MMTGCRESHQPCSENAGASQEVIGTRNPLGATTGALAVEHCTLLITPLLEAQIYSFTLQQPPCRQDFPAIKVVHTHNLQLRKQ